MEQMTSSKMPVVGQWRHSFEEDSGDLHVYRPVTYPFPPARGRAGMQLMADGTFIDEQIGATDVNQAIRGRWEYLGSGQVRLSAAPPGNAERTIEIVECGDQKLCIRDRSN
jgi:hypothetical protein